MLGFQDSRICTHGFPLVQFKTLLIGVGYVEGILLVLSTIIYFISIQVFTFDDCRRCISAAPFSIVPIKQTILLNNPSKHVKVINSRSKFRFRRVAIGSGVCFVCNQRASARASAHLPFPLAKACAWLVADRCQSPAVDCLSDAEG